MIIFKYRATASTRSRLLPELLNIIDLQIGDDRIEVLRPELEFQISNPVPVLSDLRRKPEFRFHNRIFRKCLFRLFPYFNLLIINLD